MTQLSPALIAPCGMNCGLCIGHLREKNRCPGCRSGGAELRYGCARCRIRQCEDRTGEYCYECAGYPCTRLKRLDGRYTTKYRMSMLENLQKIREQGVAEFIEQEKIRWTCPQCGSILCVHRDRCLHCGRAW